MKLNNKGVSIVEVVVTFSLIMVMVIGMFNIIMNYRDKASISIKKYDLTTFKNTLTKDIQNDILKYGIKEINTGGECNTLLNNGLSECCNIVFQNNNEKAFGISKIDKNDRNTIENKYIYYDGMKYEIKEKLPEVIPEGRDILAFQAVKIENDNIFSKDSSLLDDGTVVNIYSINVYVSHVDFDDDFGVHITAADRNIGL